MEPCGPWAGANSFESPGRPRPRNPETQPSRTEAVPPETTAAAEAAVQISAAGVVHLSQHARQRMAALRDDGRMDFIRHQAIGLDAAFMPPRAFGEQRGAALLGFLGVELVDAPLP